VILAVDASAIVAIALREAEREAFLERLGQAELIFMTPVNIIEAGLAIVLRQNLLGLDEYAEWLSELRITEVSVLGGEALRVYMTYGRGVHRAGLNLGDCFAYALAKQLEAPLLYKGNDFAVTDIRSALQPT
jgi:ribonuclease VapC